MARPRRTAEAAADAAGKSRSVLSALAARLSLPSLETGSTTLRTLTFNLIVLAMVIVVTPVLVTQFWRDQVVIEPIAVPESLAAQGFGPDIVASRVWDGLLDVQAAARTAKETLAAIPGARQVEFSFPDSGFSVESLIFHVRRLFGIYDTRIAGEFVCEGEACALADARLRLRVVRDRVDLIDLDPIGDTPERAYFAEAGQRVLAILDPFVAAAATAEREPLRATILARQLIRQGHRDQKWAHNLVGNIRAEAGDQDAAIAEYRQALALDDGFAIARVNLAAALVAAGRGDEARTELALLGSEEAARAAEVEANLALAEGRTADAIAALERGAALDPLSPRLPTRAGILALGSGDTARGEALLRSALDIDPGYSGALAALALEHMVREDYAGAERLYRDAADYAPSDAGLLAEHGRLLVIVGRAGEALQRFDASLALAPETATRLMRVDALQTLGRHDEAVGELRTALAASPDDAAVHLALGHSLRELGRQNEAIAAYRRYLDLDPEGLMRPLAEQYIALLSG